MRHAASAVLFVLLTQAGIVRSADRPSIRRDAAAPELLSSVDALPVHLIGPLLDPHSFAETADGDVLVLDRRAHAVMIVNRQRTAIRPLLTIGQELGKVLEPGVLSLGSNGVFAVADAPGGFDRVQYFSVSGTRLGGFFLPRRTGPRLLLGDLVLNGIGSMAFSDKTFLVNQPITGAIISELDVDGNVVKRIGLLRATGRESDPELHQALNVGLPLANPGGGYYFVFRTAVPMFRKYDAAGKLVFERHIEGPELDEAIASLPTEWPTRTGNSGTLPLVPSLVRAAAVDPAGRLFVSLSTGYVYVYDKQGEKQRTLQLRGAGVVSPDTMSFSKRTGRLLVTPGCYEFKVD